MYNLAVGADGVPVSGGGLFVGRLVAWLLGMDLLFFGAIAAAILIICWLVKFIITLKEDK